VGETEIGEFGSWSPPSEKNVTHLHIAVDNAVGVGVAEDVQEPLEDRGQAAPREVLAAIGESAAVGHLHC